VYYALASWFSRLGINPAKLQLAIKWSVYALLTVNFVGYLGEDWHAMRFGMPENPTLLDWVGNFATSLDVIAWLALLALFEYETWFMEDDTSPLVQNLTRLARGLCYLVLIHTGYAYWNNYQDVLAAVPQAELFSLCELVGQQAYYLWDLVYTEVNAGNCAVLGQGSEWFRIYNDEAITDSAGLAREQALALTDLFEIVSWYGIMAMLELSVQLQERGVSGGPLLKICQRVKFSLYMVLVALSIWWISIGHWLYAWDEFLWIAGFAAIELNLSQWRDEIDAAEPDAGLARGE
jgi:hypothetical protein